MASLRGSSQVGIVLAFFPILLFGTSAKVALAQAQNTADTFTITWDEEFPNIAELSRNNGERTVNMTFKSGRDIDLPRRKNIEGIFVDGSGTELTVRAEIFILPQPDSRGKKVPGVTFVSKPDKTQVGNFGLAIVMVVRVESEAQKYRPATGCDDWVVGQVLRDITWTLRKEEKPPQIFMPALPEDAPEEQPRFPRLDHTTLVREIDPSLTRLDDGNVVFVDLPGVSGLDDHDYVGATIFEEGEFPPFKLVFFDVEDELSGTWSFSTWFFGDCGGGEGRLPLVRVCWAFKTDITIKAEPNETEGCVLKPTAQPSISRNINDLVDYDEFLLAAKVDALHVMIDGKPENSGQYFEEVENSERKR